MQSSTNHLLGYSLRRFFEHRKDRLSEKQTLRLCDVGTDQGDSVTAVWKQLQPIGLPFHFLVLREGKQKVERTRNTISTKIPATIIEKNPLEILRTAASFEPLCPAIHPTPSVQPGVMKHPQQFDLVYCSSFLSFLPREELYDWIALMTKASRFGLMGCEPIRAKKTILDRLKKTAHSPENQMGYPISLWQSLSQTFHLMKLKTQKNSIIIYTK
jgi:hypothetical protein